MNIEDLRLELQKMREEWRDVRNKKMRRKEEVLSLGKGEKDVRRDRAYKELKRRQKQLSTRMRHIERRLSRKIAAVGRSK